jgi:DNA-binding NarL/FixJ family response regulator
MKVLVIDDHALIRDALRRVLKELRRDAAVLEASSAAEALETIADNPEIGLILLDLHLPDRDGLSLLAELREQRPAVSVVVLSASQDRTNVVRVLEAGARGYIPKSAKREVMLGALGLVLSGGIYVPPEILHREQMSAGLPKHARDELRHPSPADLGLTTRQIEVLSLMMKGKNNKVICRTLDLSEPTVKNHVTAILRALKVTNRTEAVIAANDMGWEFPAAADSARAPEV